MEKKIYTISKYVLMWTIIVLLICIMTGCARKPDPVETAANAAHQQIVAIKESLPKECQTKAIDEQLKAHDTTIETIKANCDLDRQRISNEKMRWKWSFFALAFIVLAHIAKKILK